LITKVWEHLHVGGLKDAKRLNANNPARIVTVVSLCSEEVLPKANSPQFEEIMQTLAEAIRCGALLLVCAAGMSRSPIMAAAWMHRRGILDFDSAMQHIEALRPTIDPSPILLRSVRGNLCR
jgi:protein-tyrosine phosphatase